MKKTDTNLVKKEIAILITAVALAVGFLGGIFYSVLNSPSGSGQNPVSQSTGQLPQDTQQQANRILALEQEIAANPENVDAMIELGDIFFDSNRYQEAIATFVKAEGLAPTNVHILNDLGQLYMNTNEYDAAIEKFEAVLNIDPTHSHTLYYIGIVYRLKGDTDKALQTFEQVLSLNPNPELEARVRQEITALKVPAPASGFPQSDFDQALKKEE